MTFFIHSVVSAGYRSDALDRPHLLRHAAAGFAWTLTFAYVLAELVTATAWPTGYSFRHDTISDLGATACTPNMCSPLHLVMNAAFVALGLTTIVGAIGFRDYIPHGPRQWSSVALAAVIGLSTAATAVFPSNDGVVVHFLAVLPAFVSRHIVLILLTVWLRRQRPLVAVWSAFYPLPTWMAVTGAAITLTPLRNAVRQRIRSPSACAH